MSNKCEYCRRSFVVGQQECRGCGAPVRDDVRDTLMTPPIMYDAQLLDQAAFTQHRGPNVPLTGLESGILRGIWGLK